MGTVAASIKNDMPVLVIQGSGRAADLIADFMEVYAAVGSIAAAPAFQGDKKALLQRARSLRLESERAARLKKIENVLTTSADYAEHIEVCRELLGMYKLLKSETTTNQDVVRIVDQLRFIAASTLCVVYPLGAVSLRKSEGGSSTPPTLLEFITRCAVRVIERPANSAGSITPSGLTMGAELSSSGRLFQSTATVAGAALSPQKGTEEECRQSSVERKLGLEEWEQSSLEKKLELMTRWGQVDMVEETLGLAEGGPSPPQTARSLPIDLLNKLLQNALVHNQARIAALALSHGATLDRYDPTSSLNNEEDVRVWRDLLDGASDELEERYLKTLIEKSMGDVTDSGRGAKGFATDKAAVEVLERVYARVVRTKLGDPVRLALDAKTHFTLDAGGAWAGGDLNLFLFSLLVNRVELGQLFFERDVKQGRERALNNALWACLLCRRLAALPEVGQYSYSLRNGFETTAAWYEKVAADILFLAFERSQRCALLALEQPLPRCPEWTNLDLLVEGDCRGVFRKCPGLCVKAMKRRFYGSGGLFSSMRRMNDALRGVPSSGFLPTEVAQVVTNVSASVVSARKGSLKWLSERSIKKVSLSGSSGSVEIPTSPTSPVTPARQRDNFARQTASWTPATPGSSTSQKNTNSLQFDNESGVQPEVGQPEAGRAGLSVLLFCILVDFVGISYHVFPVFHTYFYSILWPPVCAALVYVLLLNPSFALFALVEEALPLFDIFPTATLGWWLQGKLEEDATTAAAVPPGEMDEDNAFVSVSCPEPTSLCLNVVVGCRDACPFCVHMLISFRDFCMLTPDPMHWHV